MDFSGLYASRTCICFPCQEMKILSPFFSSAGELRHDVPLRVKYMPELLNILSVMALITRKFRFPAIPIDPCFNRTVKMTESD
jgi:hypothetical protein